jgi:starvation-inducible DNA-binding protein
MSDTHATTTPAVFESHIDIDSEPRSELIARLNRLLADAIDLQLQAKLAHWNVRGPHFIPLHELFDRVHARAVALTDLVAERIGQLGGLAEGNVQTVAARSRLDVYTQETVPGTEHVKRVASALATFGSKGRAGIDFAGSHGDEVTADILTEVTRETDELLWFVEGHLQG